MDDHKLLCSVEERGTTEKPALLSFGRVIMGCLLPILCYDLLLAAAGLLSRVLSLYGTSNILSCVYKLIPISYQNHSDMMVWTTAGSVFLSSLFFFWLRQHAWRHRIGMDRIVRIDGLVAYS